METIQKKSASFKGIKSAGLGNRNLLYRCRAYFSLCVGKPL